MKDWEILRVERIANESTKKYLNTVLDGWDSLSKEEQKNVTKSLISIIHTMMDSSEQRLQLLIEAQSAVIRSNELMEIISKGIKLS